MRVIETEISGVSWIRHRLNMMVIPLIVRRLASVRCLGIGELVSCSSELQNMRYM